jgi:3-dehydroquinate synthase
MHDLLHTLPSCQRLRVELGERSYEIMIGEHLLSHTGAAMKELSLTGSCFIVTDEIVAAKHLAALVQSLTAENISYEVITVPPGEGSKSFARLENILGRILKHKPERSSTLLALGGGVVGDLTGFAASILLRGINFVQIPTTLLSQVDSSVGGKTGINTTHGKNLIGSFYQPRLVVADISLLTSLPERELAAGYAEVVKYALINDADFFDWLEAQAGNITRKDPEILQQIIYKSCQAKAMIVAEDEREGGVRALLNLGHTFGHALEAETGFSEKLLHGEAVALGTMMAFSLSVQLGLCPQRDLDRILRHFTMMRLPTRLSHVPAIWNVDTLLNHMFQDKKVEGGKLVLILSKGIGKAFIAKDVEVAPVRTLLERMVHQH